MSLDPSVQVAAVSAGGMIVAAGFGVLVELLRRQGSTIAEVAEHAQEAREQVVNTHSTNLRDDLDRVLADLGRVLEGQAEHSRSITALRTELAHERAERLAVAERLDEHIAN
ncbi:DUF2746 domain-containing protein [Streptomyces sp. GMY02]|uniref:DUF2746 domain-containing protein n=1 Tax=unclassified Streptomyces TaxID=2593676 RepID=UPI001C2C7612|nr:DUF2746 domain-containing protein [Streptomyces sp. GMY02]QXE37116.1 DUF2746 domain-containing protein [Streptomyces sp. GMY02]